MNNLMASARVYLKKCPFCGSTTAPDYGELRLEPMRPSVVTGYWVQCFPHKGGCGAATRDGNTTQEAAAAWNGRVL